MSIVKNETKTGMSSDCVGQALAREFQGHNIRVCHDGYIHATDMCKVGGKRWNNYSQNKGNQRFFQELESVTGIPVTKLIRSIQGGDSKLQGTWVHPYIAINLAQWVSPIFAVHVAGWVAKFISGDLTLVQDVVKQANQLTGKVNNVEAKTDPTTGEVLAIAQQFDQDDRKAKKEYRKLQRKYNKLKASTTKIIAEKDDKIDTLSIEIRELKDMMRDLGIEFKGVRTELTDARVELKNSNQKLDQATDELVETKEELKNSNQKLDRATDALVETKDQLDETNNKLDRVLNERVDLGEIGRAHV